MEKLGKILIGLSLLAITGTASAIPVTGSIAFSVLPGAKWRPTEADLSTFAPVDTAVGVKFIDNGTLDNDAQVTFGDGAYTGTESAITDFTDFVFNPLAAGTLLWSFSDGGLDYSFTMNSVTIVSQTPTQIGLTGSGFASITGFDDAAGTWDLTLNKTGRAFSFSSSAAPEPGIALLLGLGLVGFGIARKVRKSA